MRADQIMSRDIIVITPDTQITDALGLMLSHHISGLPVVDTSGKLIGIVSEGDFLRRSELGTQTKRGFLSSLIAGPGKAAEEFTRQSGRKIAEVMTSEPVTVTENTSLGEAVCLMEKHHIKRLPVVRENRLVGILTRSDLLRVLAGVVYPQESSSEDSKIADRIVQAITHASWCPVSFKITVHDGVVQIRGIITDERSRQATIVAAENVPGVKQVHDHLCWIDPMSGLSVLSAEDEAAREKLT